MCYSGFLLILFLSLHLHKKSVFTLDIGMKLSEMKIWKLKKDT